MYIIYTIYLGLQILRYTLNIHKLTLHSANITLDIRTFAQHFEQRASTTTTPRTRDVLLLLIRMRVCIYIYTYTCICLYEYICTYIYIYVYIYIYIHTNDCIHTYIYIYIYIYAYIGISLSIHIYIYIYTYTHLAGGYGCYTARAGEVIRDFKDTIYPFFEAYTLFLESCLYRFQLFSDSSNRGMFIQTVPYIVSTILCYAVIIDILL